MKADIANKNMDTDYKRELRRWEPWKVITVSMGAGAAAMAAATTLAALALRALAHL